MRTAPPPRRLKASLTRSSSFPGPWLLALGGRPRRAATRRNRPAPARAPTPMASTGRAAEFTLLPPLAFGAPPPPPSPHPGRLLPRRPPPPLPPPPPRSLS